MAGSYGHVVDDSGRLLAPEDICSMLECTSGDVVEAVQEMYGMIWWLATEMAAEVNSSGFFGGAETTPASLVEEARERYLEGLTFSPGMAEG